MSDYERQAIRGSRFTLVAAALAYLTTYVAPPGPDVAAAFAIAAVVLLTAYYVLDRPDRLAGHWVVPAVAAAIVVASDTTHDLRMAALALAALSVVGFVTYPLTASAAEFGERVGEKFQ